MDDRAAQLRKLNGFRRRLPHCTASALASILADVRENGIPEGGVRRHRFKDARDFQNAAHTPFGAVLQFLVAYDKNAGDQKVTTCAALCFALEGIVRVRQLQSFLFL